MNFYKLNVVILEWANNIDSALGHKNEFLRHTKQSKQKKNNKNYELCIMNN